MQILFIYFCRLSKRRTILVFFFFFCSSQIKIISSTDTFLENLFGPANIQRSKQKAFGYLLRNNSRLPLKDRKKYKDMPDDFWNK